MWAIGIWGTPVQEPAKLHLCTCICGTGTCSGWSEKPQQKPLLAFWRLLCGWKTQHEVRLFQGPCKVLRELVPNKRAGRNSLYFKGDYLPQRFVKRKYREGWSQCTCSCDPVTFQKPRQDRKNSGFWLQESCWALTHSNPINLFPQWIITSFFSFSCCKVAAK